MNQRNINQNTVLSYLKVILIFSVLYLPVTAVNAGSKQKVYTNFNKAGELVRPTGYREWIFVGAPLTPNDMNNGKAAFPEFHNVYIDPVSWALWKKTGKFRDGAIVTKELVNVASKKSFSGNGYFQGEYIGLEAMVKSKKRFPDAPGNWGFFRFTVEKSPELLNSAKVQANESCAICHKSADTDQVFSQHYPVLRAGQGKGEMGIGGK
jgi:Cytochrome P460